MNIYDQMKEYYETKTYWGRVSYVFQGLNPTYLGCTVKNLKYSRSALKMESNEEIENSNLTEGEFYNLYRQKLYTTKSDGEYLPLLGRIAFVQVPQYISMVINAKTLKVVSDDTQNVRAFFGLRMLNHSMWSASVGAFSLHNGSHSGSHTALEYACCILPGVLFGTLGCVGAEISTAHCQAKFGNQLKGKLISAGATIIIPAACMAAVTVIARQKDWCSLFKNAGIPYYDDKGNKLGVSRDLGWFATRETASLRFLHSAVSSVFYAILVEAVSRKKVFLHAKFGSHSVSLATVAISSFVYLGIWPFIPTLTPFDTKIATRRVKDITDEHRKVIHYHRGI